LIYRRLGFNPPLGGQGGGQEKGAGGWTGKRGRGVLSGIRGVGGLSGIEWQGGWTKEGVRPLNMVQVNESGEYIYFS